MKTIYKYPIQITDGIQSIEVPKSAVPLSICNQYDHIVMYCMVDIDDRRTKEINVRVVGTGHPLDFEDIFWQFKTTISTQNGRFMWHVFMEC